MVHGIKMKKYCIECAHNKHKFEIVKNITDQSIMYYVCIDGEKFISKLRSPSHKIKCSDCGKKTNHIYERYNK